MSDIGSGSGQNAQGGAFGALTRLGFTPEQIEEFEDLRTRRGDGVAADALQAILEKHAALLPLGYTNGHIMAMATNRGEPSTKLQQAIDQYGSLNPLGYEARHIAMMISLGSRNTLQNVIDKHQALDDLGYGPDHIAVMVSNDNSDSDDLQAVIEGHQVLVDNFGYTHDDIATMLRHGRGADRLENFSDRHQALRDFGFDDDQIGEMIGAEYYDAVPAVIDNYAELIRAGLTNHHIVDMLDNEADIEFVEAVAMSSGALVRAGITANRIVEMAGEDGGAGAIRDIALEADMAFPAINAARERLDVVLDQLTIGQQQAALEAIRPANVEVELQENPDLAATLSTANGLFHFALDQAGLNSAQSHRLQQLAAERLTGKPSVPLRDPPTRGDS